MTDEKKHIEEMAKAIRPVLENRTDIGYIPDLDKPIAKELLKHYQPKIPDGAVVLTMEEFDEFRQDQAEVKFLKKQIQDQARKETAREIVNFVAEHCDNESLVWLLDEFIAKQYGVEVEE